MKREESPELRLRLGFGAMSSGAPASFDMLMLARNLLEFS